jgi:hypothetical protein
VHSPASPTADDDDDLLDVFVGDPQIAVTTGRQERGEVHVAEGSPTVILESGLGEASTYWGWIEPAVVQDTKVCV